jgi:hypothetical protein
MPVPNQTPVNSSTGNGVTTVFPYTFKILEDADILVQVDGVTKTLSTHYTVSGAGVDGGGNVTFITAPADGSVVVRKRNLGYERVDFDYQEGGGFEAATVDEDIDRLVMMLQQLNANLLRAPKAPASVTADQVLSQDDWDARASKMLGFDSSGNLTLVAGGDGDAETLAAQLASTALVANGDALVGVKLNATDAEATTQHQVNEESVAVQRFMTAAMIADVKAGTKAVDITTAFTKAFTAAAARAVSSTYKQALKLLTGIYKLTGTLSPSTFLDLEGEGRWNTRLMFALTAAGNCVNLQGADTNNRIRSTLRRLRIDGTDCTHAAVVGVACDWNQNHNPLLDEVTIYGGYQAGGATTGLKNGLVFKEDGSNWQTGTKNLHVEGCHGDGVVMDTASGGSHNAIQHDSMMVENNAGRALVLIGPNDDIKSTQINFNDGIFQGSSYNTTGVASSVHCAGVWANFTRCWFEAAASPNWATHEIRVESGRVCLHDCNIAWSQRGIWVGGTVVLSGYNKIRSNTTGIVLGSGGRLVIRGEVEFLGAGTPISLTDETSTIDWVRERSVDKTANYQMSSSDIGSTITNQGAKQNITITMALCPSGATMKFLNAVTNVRNSTYRWVASASGTNEYYLELAAGGDPGFADPAKFYQGPARTKGTVGALANLEWGYGDNDTLGFNTIYYRLDSGDPDALQDGNLFCTYTITLATSNNQRFVPVGLTTSDSIVSDGTPGACLDMVMRGGTPTGGFWVETSRSPIGSWT